MVGSEIKRWTLDNAHSSVEFVVRHMMISNVRGSFKEFSEDIKWILTTLNQQLSPLLLK